MQSRPHFIEVGSLLLYLAGINYSGIKGVLSSYESEYSSMQIVSTNNKLAAARSSCHLVGMFGNRMRWQRPSLTLDLW